MKKYIRFGVKALVLVIMLLLFAVMIAAIYGAAYGLTWCWKYVVVTTTMADAGWRWAWAILIIIGILTLLMSIALAIYESKYQKPAAKISLRNSFAKASTTVGIAAAIVALIYAVYGGICGMVWMHNSVVLTMTQEAGRWANFMAIVTGLVLLVIVIIIAVVMLAIALNIYESNVENGDGASSKG